MRNEIAHKMARCWWRFDIPADAHCLLVKFNAWREGIATGILGFGTRRPLVRDCIVLSPGDSYEIEWNKSPKGSLYLKTRHVRIGGPAELVVLFSGGSEFTPMIITVE